MGRPTNDEKNAWLDEAKHKLNEAFESAIKSDNAKRIRITLSRNPMQVVEVDPDIEAAFNAQNVE